ncbi:hypothetical protein [Thiococcus pfennigii]|jgi:hypothetical protein|uniref:hypothetical protein n=1 Tax=Thiococcus pfennigii TaxID=1057 RepID=UPI00190600D2|nr:hypothetical protein [Thiococcus pfennigii]MBK1732549.1 hypothetical protein [Thiococcus pfennigii]
MIPGASLPDPDGLSPERAEAARWHLFVNVAPRLLDDAAAAVRGYHAGTVSLVDWLAAESRVGDLLTYAERLLARHPAPQARAAGFADLDRTQPGIVRASAPLAFCPESIFLVHGPIILGAVAALAEGLLSVGERLVGAEGVRFRRPVRHALTLTISETPQREGGILPSVSGTLATDAGRRLWFTGRQRRAEPVIGWIDNGSARQLLPVDALTTDAGDYRLQLAAGVVAVGVPPAFAIQLILEAALRAIKLLRAGDGRAILLGGFRRLAVPTDLSSRLAAGIELNLTLSCPDHPPDRGTWTRLRAVVRSDDGAIQIEALCAERYCSLAGLLA